jgi:alpha-galactosidase
MKRTVKYNNFLLALTIICLVITSACTSKLDKMVTSGEMRVKEKWVKEHLLVDDPQLPFSFLYDGKATSELLKTWQKKTETTKLDNKRTQYTRFWTEIKTGLEVRCVALEYADFPLIEWTVYLKNTGINNTANLKNIQGLETVFKRNDEGEFILHYNTGDLCREYSYEPHRKQLDPGTVVRIAPIAGRSTSGSFPYSNIEMAAGGVILAVGWPGQWACSFTRDDNNELLIKAGQELTNLYLKPNEEIRTPLIVLMFWKGDDTIRANNLWRRWYMAHNIPKINGKPPDPIAQIQLCRSFNDGADVMQEQADIYDKAGIDIDVYWRDAGWYPCDMKWSKTGTWEVDAKRFPNGFKPVSDWIHSHGKKLIVWFEPERVSPGSQWYQEFPEWILKINPQDTVFRREPDPMQQIWVDNEANRNQINSGDALFNLGDEKARIFLTDYISNFITEQGIDYYRQDFNISPLKFWKNADLPDRQGMVENKYIVGLLRFWDELRARHPNILIDECSSGGRRNDLETMRRAVPLLRSDYQWHNTWEGQQAQTYGISSWLPYYGSGVNSVDKYQVRSFYMPSFGFGNNQDMKKVKFFYDECRKVAPMMLGDYYPLTPYTLQLDKWIAWQFDRPEQGEGMIQAFRRINCDSKIMTFRLSGLNPAARYEVTNFDLENSTKISGRELIERGVTIEINDKPGAAVITYKVLK